MRLPGNMRLLGNMQLLSNMHAQRLCACGVPETVIWTLHL